MIALAGNLRGFVFTESADCDAVSRDFAGWFGIS